MSTKLASRLCLLSIVFLFAVTVSYSQATRTWVSGVGDDVNPCSRTAPCKTFAGAISKTATGGEINCLDPAGYGAVTITKSITIDCTGTQGSILASGVTGLTINAPKGTVRLRAINVNGAGATPGSNGINIMSAGKVFIEGSVFDGFSNSGISIRCAGCQTVISTSSFRNNTQAGISVVPTEGTATVFITGSLIVGNGTGIIATSSAVRISGNKIAHNLIGIAPGTNGSIISYRDNTIDGNGSNGTPTSTVSLQ